MRGPSSAADFGGEEQELVAGGEGDVTVAERLAAIEVEEVAGGEAPGDRPHAFGAPAFEVEGDADEGGSGFGEGGDDAEGSS